MNASFYFLIPCVNSPIGTFTVPNSCKCLAAVEDYWARYPYSQNQDPIYDYEVQFFNIYKY